MKELMNTVFYLCVDLLRALAKYFGTTYEIINVWIFCIIGPIVFVLLLIIILNQKISLIKRKVIAS